MLVQDSLFEISPHLTVRYEKIGAGIPVLFAENFFAQPDAVREAALRLPFAPAPFSYPGRIAPPPEHRGFAETARRVLELVNAEFLSRVPIRQDGQRIAGFRQVHSDFAIVDVHPDELEPVQRLPHTDPVAVFGLVYLNRDVRGGTLFFEQVAESADGTRHDGYVTGDSPDYQLRGRIAAQFNTLVIYPGFIPHSAEIEGEWIRSEARFASPRLTQRFAFLA